MALALQAPDTQPDPLKPKPPVVAGAPLPALGGGAAPLTLAQPAGAAQGPAGAMTPPPMTPPPSTAATPANRLQLATDAFNTSAASTQGAYDAASRDNVHNSAALGQVGSGGLRTREGNLQLARGRDLDALRSKLVTDAAVGSIEDQRATDAQKIAQQNADTSRIGTTGNLDVAKGGLELAKTGQEAQIWQTQQQIDLAKKTADINAAYQSGQLSLAQKDQALRELSNQQQFGIQSGQLELAKSGQEQQGQQEAARLSLAKDQLAQTGQQFGLSLAQQKDLALLADKTQNRQVDLSQQGLALELARITGDDKSVADPDFLAAIAKALGYAIPPKQNTSTTTTTPTVQKRPDGTTINPGDADWKEPDTRVPGTY